MTGALQKGCGLGVWLAKVCHFVRRSVAVARDCDCVLLWIVEDGACYGFRVFPIRPMSLTNRYYGCWSDRPVGTTHPAYNVLVWPDEVGWTGGKQRTAGTCELQSVKRVRFGNVKGRLGRSRHCWGLQWQSCIVYLRATVFVEYVTVFRQRAFPGPHSYHRWDA